MGLGVWMFIYVGRLNGYFNEEIEVEDEVLGEVFCKFFCMELFFCINFFSEWVVLLIL